MLRIAIADDEERIGRGLAKIVRSASDEYEVAGVFANGAELLRFVEEEGADVVITDIRMPVMDGLKVAEKLHAEHPGVRCVIVSGYSDFDYARTAMRYQVRDYLLKPVDKAELYRVLREMAKDVAEARRQAKLVRRLKLERALAGDASAEPVIPDRAFAVWYAVRTETAVELDELEAAAHSEDGAACAVAVRDRAYGVLLELALERFGGLRDGAAQLARRIALLRFPEHGIDQVHQGCHRRLRLYQRPAGGKQLLAEGIGRRRLARRRALQQDIGGALGYLRRAKAVVGGDRCDRLRER